MSRLAPALLVALALTCRAAPARAEAPAVPPAHVTLPLTTYQQLRDSDERPGVTVVDMLRLGGSFKARDLWVQLSGRASGRLPDIEILTAPPGVRLYNCEGDGLITRDKDGAFTLHPLAQRFRLTCRLGLLGSDRLQLVATPAVLWVDAQVSDGELAGGDESGGRRTLSVMRLQGGTAETVRPTATARYRLSLHPDETRFRYELLVRNPNRAHQPFFVTPRSGEHVQQVDAQASYEIEPGSGRYRFQLPPGETALVLSGTLSGARFLPPVEAGVHYLLLEAHPLLRPQVSGAPRRISAGETGLTASFRGAQAFLLGGDETLSWTVARLSALRTTSFAVSRARHSFFLSADGVVLGESQLFLDNQGAPDLTLPMRAEPTFASLQDEPSLLTRNEAGDLWLPLSQGEQRVVVQHRQPLRARLGLGMATLYLPQLQAPATQADIELRFPQEWLPLYAEFSPDAQLLAFDGWDMVWLVLLLLWTERGLAALGLGRERRLLLAGTLCLSAALVTGCAVALVLADVGVTALWLWPRLRVQSGVRLFLGLCAAGALGLIVLAMFSMRASAPSSPSYSDNMVVATRSSKLVLRPNGETKGEDLDGKPADTAVASNGPGGGQGLPAKFTMPGGARGTGFHREMLNTEAPRAVRVLLLARRALGMVAATAIVLALLLLGLNWRRLREGARALRRLAEPLAPGAQPL